MTKRATLGGKASVFSLECGIKRSDPLQLGLELVMANDAVFAHERCRNQTDSKNGR